MEGFFEQQKAIDRGSGWEVDRDGEACYIVSHTIPKINEEGMFAEDHCSSTSHELQEDAHTPTTPVQRSPSLHPENRDQASVVRDAAFEGACRRTAETCSSR